MSKDYNKWLLMPHQVLQIVFHKEFEDELEGESNSPSGLHEGFFPSSPSNKKSFSSHDF